MTEVLQQLSIKNLIDADQFEILNSLGKGVSDFFQRVIQGSCASPVSKVYSPELRTFALTLHYYSPRAYKYVRETFNACLPHANTIYKWYQSVDGEPGINEEALECIKQKVNLVNRKLVGSILFDEMAIRQQTEFDGKKYYGYVNMGLDSSTLCVDIAKEVLVFMFVCMNEAWKIPIAYYVVKSVC